MTKDTKLVMKLFLRLPEIANVCGCFSVTILNRKVVSRTIEISEQK